MRHVIQVAMWGVRWLRFTSAPQQTVPSQTPPDGVSGADVFGQVHLLPCPGHCCSEASTVTSALHCCAMQGCGRDDVAAYCADSSALELGQVTPVTGPPLARRAGAVRFPRHTSHWQSLTRSLNVLSTVTVSLTPSRLGVLPESH